MVGGKVWDSTHTIKYCKTPDCPEVITMVGYDTQGYINAIQYCPKCAEERHKESKRASSRRKRDRIKAWNAYGRERKRLAEAQEVQRLKEAAADLRAKTKHTLEEKSIEEQQAAEIRRLKREIASLKSQSSLGMAAYLHNRAMERMKKESD